MSSESDFIKTVFGLKLRQQRQKRNWSLQDLADKTKLSKSYLNEIENGKKLCYDVASGVYKALPGGDAFLVLKNNKIEK